MPFTHIDIQKERQWKSIFLFIILILYYFFGFLILGNVIRLFIFFRLDEPTNMSPFLTIGEIQICLLAALVFGIGHWIFAIMDGVDRILSSLQAESPDPNDRYHQQFMNIIEEIQIATGGHKVRPVIIPTLASNAFAVATNENNAVIGVTEGLLAKLSRPQLECVIAHEMAHVVNNDCILTTIACSLFASFAQLLQLSISGAKSSRSFQPWIFVGVIWILTTGARILNMAVSRQREFLADATAVRLSRNPTGLAEALLKLANAWRGFGYADESMAPIFIMNPAEKLLDQQESLFADLFSTHPPIRRRLDVLMELAHMDLSSLVASVSSQNAFREGAKEQVQTVTAPSLSWFVKDNDTWQGPFSPQQMITLKNLFPFTWVSRDNKVMQASEDPNLQDILKAQFFGKDLSQNLCPRCHQFLTLHYYEGTPVKQCHFCEGTFLHESHLFRVLARREIGFSDEFKKKVKIYSKQSVWFPLKHLRPIDLDPSQQLKCPGCPFSMVRSFYSLQYFVVVDRCYICNSLWFDKEELEMLQLMVEESPVGQQ